MKRTILLFMAIFLIGLLYAKSQLSKNQQAVQQTVVKMFEALSNRDSAGLKFYCAQDILLFENGQVWNIDTLIAKGVVLNTAADFKRTNSFDFINTETNDNIAWVSYTLRSETIKNGKQGFAQWMETVVLVKEKNQWKIKLLHSTLINRS